MHSDSLARPRPHEVLRIEPREQKTLSADRWFVDFGRAAFATIELDVTASGGDGRLEVHLGEKLSAPRVVDREPPGCVRYRRVEQPLRGGRHTYRLVIPPDKRNTGPQAIHMPPELFEVLPFRYAELESCGAAVEIHGVTQLMVRYPFDEHASAFSSSSENLNRVWELCRYSIQATSFARVYVDGDRERIPYEGDAYINQLCHYGVDRDYELARATLEYLIYHPTWPTEWHLHCVPMAWADYLYTGDPALLHAYYGELRHKLLLPLARGDGLISTCGDQPGELLAAIHLDCPLRDLVDWPPGSFTQGGVGERDGHEMMPYNTVVNAFHWWNLVLFEQIARVTGHDEDERYMQARHVLVGGNLMRLFDETKGAFLDGEGSTHSSQHASLFPAAFGFLPPEQENAVADFLVSRGMACSVYAAHYLLDALYRLGRGDAALALMTAEHDRSWLNMLRAGSTVTLEAWDWKYKNNLDWNHAWGAAPANIIPRRLVGVQPLAPGFALTQVAPQPGSLAWFESTVPTRDGAVHVRYERREAGEMLLHLDAEGCPALQVDLSFLAGGAARVVLDGALQPAEAFRIDNPVRHEIRIASQD